MKKLLIIFIVGWLATLLRHVYIFPSIDWQEHEITGFEFKINFKMGKGQ